MDRKSAENFFQKNSFCDHGHVIWKDGSEDEFGLILRVEDLIEYASVYEYIAGKALAWYQERKKEEIKSLGIAG